jgi:hypothetical protein
MDGWVKVLTSGLSCAVCKNDCPGCPLQPDDHPIKIPHKDKTITLAINWEQKILDDFYDDNEASVPHLFLLLFIPFSLSLSTYINTNDLLL